MMKLRKEALRQKTFFRRFFVPYLFILILPLLLASFAYNEAVRIVEREARQSKLIVLEQARDILDNYFNDLDETFIQLSMDTKLSKLMRIEAPFDNSPLWYDVWDYLNEIRSRAVTGGSLQSSFFIALRDGGLVLTSSQTVHSAKLFYEDAFRFDGMSYEEWRDLLFGKRYMKTIFPAAKAVVDGKESSVITYMSSLPIHPADANLGVVSFLIDVGDIGRLIGSKGSDSGRFAILDGSGRYIMGGEGAFFDKLEMQDLEYAGEGNHPVLKLNGENVMYVHTRSSYNDWTYVSALPLEEVMGDVIRIRNAAVAAAALSLFVGLLFSVLFAYRGSKPLQEMIGALKEFWTKTRTDEHPAVRSAADDFSFLSGSLTHLMTDHQHLRNTLEFQNAALKNVFFDRLLKGEFGDQAGMEELRAYVGLALNGKAFTVVALQRYRHRASLHPVVLEELDVLREHAEAVIGQLFPGRSHAHIVNENELAVLLCREERDDAAFSAEVRAMLDRMLADIRERGGIAPIVGVGGIYASLTDASYSFQEARQALGRQLAEEPDAHAVVWYEEIKKEYTGYYYPTEMEIKLMNIVKSGAVEEAQRILGHLRHENETVRSLTPDMMQCLLNDLNATLYKLHDQIKSEPEKDEPSQLTFLSSGAGGFDGISARFEQLCRAVEAGKKSRNTRLAHAVCDYIGESFTDANLSLSEVASRFNMSESYLSQFFREQTGETFSAYVESLRIGLARRLIREGESIDEIALKTGYNSTHSFRRAFKRVMGIVPSAYKQTDE